ncbi:MAG: hypothetical protein GXO09_02490 [Crenarchaeota archaeon]|nr:hypothetical protein [Thermoproteota archaeon]
MDEDPLVLIDKAMGILEELEKSIGRVSSSAEKGEVRRGQVFRLYNLVVNLEETLRELRRLVYEKCR